MAVIAILVGLVGSLAGGWADDETSEAQEVVANARQWTTTSGEILSITTLPGKTMYAAKRSVQAWHANAEVAVGDDTVIVRLPDDALVIEGSILPLWYSIETGEVRATEPDVLVELEGARAILAHGPTLMPYFFIGAIAALLGLLILSILRELADHWLTLVWRNNSFVIEQRAKSAYRRAYRAHTNPQLC